MRSSSFCLAREGTLVFQEKLLKFFIFICYVQFGENICVYYLNEVSWHLQEIKKDREEVHVAMLWQALICTTSVPDVVISLLVKMIV